jgi:alpha-methylacyl-CoA racemase
MYARLRSVFIQRLRAESIPISSSSFILRRHKLNDVSVAAAAAGGTHRQSLSQSGPGAADYHSTHQYIHTHRLLHCLSQATVSRTVSHSTISSYSTLRPTPITPATTGTKVTGPSSRRCGPGPLHLQGTRVLDLSRLLPGPYCSLLLSDLGADVVRVESPHKAQGDWLRSFPPLAADGVSTVFHALNRGKRSICLDLKTDSDRDKLLQLASKADVLIEGFRPGTMKKLGLCPEEVLKKQCPQLVVCSISGFGQTGPLAQHSGHDLGYLAHAGLLGMMRDPSPLPVQLADLAGGAWPATTSILAALIGRQRTGRGVWIDQSMTDGALAMAIIENARVAGGAGPIGHGKSFLAGAAPCYAVYRTSDDGHVCVAALEEPYWLRLVDILTPEIGNDQADMIRQHRFDAHIAGPVLSNMFEKHSTDYWEDLLESKDVMTDVVREPEHLATKDPEFKIRHMSVPVTVAGQQLDLPNTPLHMEGAVAATQPAPKLGEHTDTVLNEWLSV